MKKTELAKRGRLALAAACTGLVFQGGCGAFLIGEIEALLAPASAGNALFVLDSVFFNILAPLLY